MAYESVMESHPAHQAHTKNHILLIDGNAAQRNLLVSLLKDKLSYKITELSNKTEVMSHLERQHSLPDLFMLDVSTTAEPCDIVVTLRHEYPEIPVIVLVKYGDYQEAAEALLLGAQDFLTKPVACERLNVTLRNAIALRNARREAKNMQQNKPQNPVMNEAVISLMNEEGNAKKIEEIEKDAIKFAITYYNGRMTEVARRLGIGRSTLYRKLNTMNIPAL